MFKLLYLALVLQTVVGTAVPASWAQTVSASASAVSDQAQQTPAGNFIQDIGNKAINVIKDKSLTQEQRNAKYHEILRNAFDLKTIGHFVIGHAWDTATPEQQQEYMKLFEDLVVKLYGDRISLYSGENFHVKGVRSENDQDIMVSSVIEHPGGAQPTTVDWRVRQKGGNLAIVDVIVEGVSQSVTQRQEYSSIIQRDGGKLDGLLATMRQRVEGAPADANKQ